MPRPSAFATLVGVALCTTPAVVGARQLDWSPTKLGKGVGITRLGDPRVIGSGASAVLRFDGDDALLVDENPLAGATAFTVEMIVRPDGGPFEQRLLHIAATDPRTGLDALPSGRQDPNPRIMTELRVVDGQWYLDTFTSSAAGQRALIDPAKRHPLGRWHAVAQTFDGKVYRSFVDGVEQGRGELSFVPLGRGRTMIGARMNRIDYFTGAIARIRITDRALARSEMLSASRLAPGRD